MNVLVNDSESPSAGKPSAFIEYLIKEKIALDMVSDFPPLTKDDFYLAHDPDYVEGVLNHELSNGFGNKSKSVARSLPYTTGSFFSSAEYAVKNKENTFSPTSGFHHARYFRGGGFCTFNGLIIAALKLKDIGMINRVAIIDCDQHIGDGSEDIIKRFSLDWIDHYNFGRLGITDKNSESWLSNLPKDLNKFKDADVVFYQAAADPHKDDPMGGYLTSDQLHLRDEIVFRTFHELKIPVVWNLAGGYQKPLNKVLEIHRKTFEIALKFHL